jgi:hypothetical protein
MTQPNKPAFNKGGEAAVAAAEAGGNFARLEYLGSILKGPDDSVTLRFITDSAGDDSWIFVKQHGFIKTKNAPADAKSWPKVMPAICRYDSAFAGMYHDCAICDLQITDDFDKYKPAIRVWALACVRVPVIATQEMIDESDGKIPPALLGKPVGYADDTREVEQVDDKGEPTGKKVLEKRIIVVNQGVKNFFSYLQGIAAYHGTVCDRDVAITRVGEKIKTDFRIIPLDKTPALQPGTEKWDRYAKAIKEQGISIEDRLTEMSSDEYFAKFFDPRVSAPASDAKGDAATPPPVAAPSNDVNPDALKALREQVAGRGKPAPVAPVTVPDYE